MVPYTSEVNFTPTSTGEVAPSSAVVGVKPLPQMEQGQLMLTFSALEGVSVLPLSSVARDSMVALGLPCAPVQVYDHVVDAPGVTVAGCQVPPPSVETSTPATTPPLVSLAVPVMVTGAPSGSAALGVGEVMDEVGGPVAADDAPGTRPPV